MINVFLGFKETSMTAHSFFFFFLLSPDFPSIVITYLADFENLEFGTVVSVYVMNLEQ